MKNLEKCAICGDNITDDQMELSYCPHCLTTFHFKCIKKHLFHESLCPECGKTATLLTFGHGQPRKLKLPSAFEKEKVEEKLDEVDVLLATEPSAQDGAPTRAAEPEKKGEEYEEFIEEEEWEEEPNRSRWIAIAIIIAIFFVIAIAGSWYILKGSPPFG